MMKILVVDDEVDVQHLFLQGFRNEIRNGVYAFSFVFDAPSALLFLDTLKPTDVFLILSDINMPGMSGIEMLKEVRSRRPDLNVIMVTAYGDKKNYEASMKHGALDLITKPINFNTLREKLSTLDISR
jgi:YesN/AraC family two-component response regulator